MLMTQMLMTRNYRPHLLREEGQALVEYALILSLIALVAFGVLGVIGTRVNNVLNAVAGAL
jgi:Flp pilus assembly pilin Flp